MSRSNGSWTQERNETVTENFSFRRMRYIMNRIPVALMKVERAKSRATKITQTLSDMPHGSGVHSQVEDGAISIDEAEAAYYDVLKELAEMRECLKPYIDCLEEPNLRAVIRLRYLKGYPARDIANALYKCERHIYRELDNAEKKISQLMDDDNKDPS